MIEINFQGNSVENLLRKITAFVEKIDVKEVPKRGRHERKENSTAGSGEINLG